MSYLPRILVTSGEPAGIGPDLCLKIVQREWPCDLVVAADRAVLEARARLLELPVTFTHWSNEAARSPHRAGTVRVLPESADAPVDAGRLNAANARYVLRLLDRAIDGCRAGEFDAMVTAPVQKSVINEGGIAFRGHTEYIAERTSSPLPVMLLAADRLRVALATTHLPLAQVSAALDTARLVDILGVIDRDLRRRFGFVRPRILVCGLNPHAGESGHLGREEIEVIRPAIEQARARDIDASGPVPAR